MGGMVRNWKVVHKTGGGGMIRDEKQSLKSDCREMKEHREKRGDMEIDDGGIDRETM